MVKFTVSNITDYHLKWLGIVENSTGKRKTSHIHFALLNSDPCINERVRAKLSV